MAGKCLSSLAAICPILPYILDRFSIVTTDGAITTGVIAFTGEAGKGRLQMNQAPAKGA